MQRAAIVFQQANTVRSTPIMVDFERLIRRDTLITHPPNVNSTLDILE
jgi:hypothetical protein